MGNGLIEVDTRNVLNREYSTGMIRAGLFLTETPIFDNLAAERFARD